ncbi:hypothetical protein [Corynebacterium rouxii]|uniref:Uncharacterized protein n=1 Tax=Corynebacterium rouxii TaxID=2719119 RepID=A0ABU3PJC4_9CORY|nr:hypothetical protein [Corynebacterium rouxii]MDT9407756.1 hypothetical protein [Corynebacterium rouxii]MDT9409937.1 hypothetical protein [Corynebacterium rouxii]
MRLEFHSILDNDVVGIGGLVGFRGGVSGSEVGAYADFSELLTNGFVCETGLFGLFQQGDHLPRGWNSEFGDRVEQSMRSPQRISFVLGVSNPVFDLSCFGFNFFLVLAQLVEFLLSLD